MTNQIDLNSFSAKKYKSELYQLRLNSYLEKSEDFEESDFIESEQKYFNSCYNSVDQIFYNNSFVDWSELKDEIGTQEFYDMKPKPDTLTSKYITNNPNEEERLQKTFSLITAFLNKKEDIHSKKIEYPQFEPAIIEDVELKNEFKDFFNSDIKIEVVEKIQNDFKFLKGKKMAYLIYLLHREFKIINYSLDSKTESRKHFVKALKGIDFRMSGIDRYFKYADVTIDNSEITKPDYADLKEKLSKTIV